ncbi:MAG TPA: four helix bundle protein [Planctomycetota bacterium]|nr:four helix bundle protein [Planctomycetota bacterium]HRT97226.1 four helix bundle protein [Planctomycetota bacterium]
MAKLKSFRDLRVYQELTRLHLEVHRLSLAFPKFETYELGSQVRRSSNSAPALLAEGWGSRHTNVYIEAVNRSMGEVRETQHHLDMAREKGYLPLDRSGRLDAAYESCGRMMERLHQALSDWRGTTRTGHLVQEEQAPYGRPPAPTWEQATRVTEEVDGLLTPNTCPPTPDTTTLIGAE